MKSAKEWAADVVMVPACETGRWAVHLDDGEDYVSFEKQTEASDARDIYNDASGIVERLVERVQADAEASIADYIAEQAASFGEKERYALAVIAKSIRTGEWRR